MNYFCRKIKIPLIILIFFGFIPGVFCDTINNEEKKTKNITIDLWNFKPIQLLTLKKNIFDPRIYRDDESLLRFVDNNISLSKVDYKPNDLVSMEWKYLNQAGRNSYIRKEARESLEELSKKFFEKFNEPLIAISGYRSAQYQQRLWDLWRCNDGAFCAKPGYSEHQLWLAIDFFDATSEKEYITNPRYKNFVIWMNENAYKYWWTQSYKHWVEVDGYEIEPWHWRYVWVNTAKFLHLLNISYWKYLQLHRYLEVY